MKRALVVDTVLVALLSAVALVVGSALALKVLYAAAPVIVVDGPDVLSRFQQRVGWACGLTPVFGWVALLPLHLKGTPSFGRRVITLMAPLVCATAACVVAVLRLRVALAEPAIITPLVGVDSLPLASTALEGATVAAAVLLALNLRHRSAL